MPHKHVRRKDGDFTHHDLPPTAKAKPLPAFTKTSKSGKKRSEESQWRAKRKRDVTDDYKEDDTPRAFARMMQFQATKTRPNGLDDGTTRRAKKAKLSQSLTTEVPIHAPSKEKIDIPKIMPGESLADYSARVDQALPVGGLARKGKVKIEGIKERQTKTEKRLHKMYASWREEEARRKEKLEEAQEEEQDAEDEREAALGKEAVRLPEGKKGKRRRMVGETEDDGDPWAVLSERREKPKGLHDVVQAPPNFKAVPKEKFKVRNGAKVNVDNVPTAAGSLKRREELSGARRDVIERYRAMMKGGG